jgi:hypothetical protein
VPVGEGTCTEKRNIYIAFYIDKLKKVCTKWKKKDIINRGNFKERGLSYGKY